MQHDTKDNLIGFYKINFIYYYYFWITRKFRSEWKSLLHLLW